MTSVTAYRDYVQEFSDKLIGKAFFSPKTVRMAQEAGTLTTFDVADNKAVVWQKDFSAASGATSVAPRHLDVVAIKRDLSFCPQEFESNYLGFMRGKGQNPGEDLPFAGFILEQILAKHAEEIETALWSGVKAGTVTPGTTAMNAAFNGLLKLITDAVTGGLSPVATPGGAITTSNIVALVESMWDSLGAGYKENPVYVWMSWKNYQRYQQGYRSEFGKYTTQGPDARTTLDFGQNAILLPSPGLGTSNRIIMTPANNIHVGYDDFEGAQIFNFEQNKRVIDYWMDFKIGVQLARITSDVLVVNDLT
jgi:hypothetical protein